MKDRTIPEDFYNSETGKPFDSCLVCNENVLSSSEPYYVERIFRKVHKFNMIEPIFEYAMCHNCADDLRKRMSKESMKNIENYFREKLKGRPIFTEANASNQIKYCLFTGKEISDCTEFSYHAQFVGNHLSNSIFPYAVSDDAMEELVMLLSDETTEALDDFKGKHFSGPPEFADLINPKRLIPL